MDFVRVQGLTIRPSPCRVCGCSRRQRMQLMLGWKAFPSSSSFLQRHIPGPALGHGKRSRAKSTSLVRASISPDAAVAAFTAVAVLPACLLLMNRFKIPSATSSSDTTEHESAGTATAFAKSSTALAEPNIQTIHSHNNGSARTAVNGEVSELRNQHVMEIELKQNEHRCMSGFLASTSEPTSAEHIRYHLEDLEESDVDASLLKSSNGHVKLVVPSVVASVCEAEPDSSAGVISELKINGAFSSLKEEMIDGPAEELSHSPDTQVEGNGDIVELLEERLNAVNPINGAMSFVEAGEGSIVSDHETEVSVLEDSLTVDKEVDSLTARSSKVSASTTLHMEVEDMEGKPAECSPSSVGDVDVRSPPANGNSRRELWIEPKVPPPVRSKISKTSTMEQKGVNKINARKLPRRLSDILPIEKTADPDLHLKIYRALISAGRVQDSVLLLEAMNKVNILDTSKIHQSRFFKTCQAQKAVREAFRFMRLISRPTLNTYNMLISVCREARDVDGGLRALSAAEKSGFKPDAILYTTLISTCAKAGKVDVSFRVYHDMEAAGVVPKIQTYGSLIDGCARAGHISKAFGVYGIMLSKQVKPDLAIFNTLINACGRAGALERAFDVLSDMKGEPCFLQPNHVTYGALISACAKAGQVDRAFDVYRSMRKSDMKGSPECYTAAVHACSATGDLGLAHTVLEDMKIDGVQPDEIFFSSLVDVAGHANDMEGAFKILDEMKELGMTPKAVTYSSLMGVCSNTGNWERALKLYHEIRGYGLVPTVSTYNALITALSDAKQINPAFSVLEEMKGVGVMPDQITYSILLAACEMLDEPDIAFQLYAKARAEGLVPNQSICDSVVGICYARIRKRLPPSGFLEPIVSGPSLEEPHKQWTNWALSAYRQTVAAGFTPTIKSLSRLLGCLRNHEAPETMCPIKETLFSHDHDTHLDLLSSILDAGSLYDPKALVLFEEAASMGIVTRFNYTAGPITLHAELLPSYVAEVSLLTLLKNLKKRHAAGAQLFPVTIKHFVEIKHTLTATKEVKELHISGRSGQAMAALLRRLKLHYQGHESSGTLKISVASIKKWLKPVKQSDTLGGTKQNQRQASLSPRNVFVAKNIADQQRAIRMGGGPNFPSKVDLLGSESPVMDIYRKQVSQVSTWDLKDGDLEAEQDNFSINSTTSNGKVHGARRLQSVGANAVKD